MFHYSLTNTVPCPDVLPHTWDRFRPLHFGSNRSCKRSIRGEYCCMIGSHLIMYPACFNWCHSTSRLLVQHCHCHRHHRYYYIVTSTSSSSSSSTSSSALSSFIMIMIYHDHVKPTMRHKPQATQPFWPTKRGAATRSISGHSGSCHRWLSPAIQGLSVHKEHLDPAARIRIFGHGEVGPYQYHPIPKTSKNIWILKNQLGSYHPMIINLTSLKWIYEEKALKIRLPQFLFWGSRLDSNCTW